MMCLQKGMNHSDRCRFCHEFGAKTEPFLCEGCRDKIFNWLNSKGWAVIPAKREPEKEKK